MTVFILALQAEEFATQTAQARLQAAPQAPVLVQVYRLLRYHA
jgi:hypothetical protein